MERIKIIWDFRGPNAKPIAEHHAIHLKEFISSVALKNIHTGTEAIFEMHHIAYMIVNKNDVDFLRKRLKPHRGQIYIEE